VELLERVKRVLERLVHEKFSKRNWLKRLADPCLAKKMRSERPRVVLHCGEGFKNSSSKSINFKHSSLRFQLFFFSELFESESFSFD
jgi:hypothetical protein